MFTTKGEYGHMRTHFSAQGSKASSSSQMSVILERIGAGIGFREAKMPRSQGVVIIHWEISPIRRRNRDRARSEPNQVVESEDEPAWRARHARVFQ